MESVNVFLTSFVHGFGVSVVLEASLWVAPNKYLNIHIITAACKYRIQCTPYVRVKPAARTHLTTTSEIVIVEQQNKACTLGCASAACL